MDQERNEKDRRQDEEIQPSASRVLTLKQSSAEN